MNWKSALADSVVILHFAYVATVVLGLLAIWIGYGFQWRWVHNVWFRCAHLAMILIVVFEAMLGIVCPLTTLENHLRASAGQTVRDGAFFAQVVHDLIFYDAPQWMFVAAYCVFGGLVLATFVLVPPGRRKRG